MTLNTPPSKGRRDFLRFAASSLGAAAAATILPASIRKALALPANNRTGTIEDIEHIVILMGDEGYVSITGRIKDMIASENQFTASSNQ